MFLQGENQKKLIFLHNIFYESLIFKNWTVKLADLTVKYKIFHDYKMHYNPKKVLFLFSINSNFKENLCEL